MRNEANRKFMAGAAFSLGIILTVIGGGTLMSLASGGSRLAAAFSSCLVAVGVLCAVLAVRLHRRSRYLFVAAFLIMTGVYLLLSAGGVIQVPFLRSWPLLSVFSGLSLIPAGYHRYGTWRSRFVVPSLAFTVLGSVLLFFSFGIVPFSFRQFILNWWPLLLVLAGVLLLLVSFGARDSGTEESDS